MSSYPKKVTLNRLKHAFILKGQKNIHLPQLHDFGYVMIPISIHKSFFQLT